MTPHRDLQRVPGSFRDPAGGVFEADGNIYRTVTAAGAAAFQAAREAGVLDLLVDRRMLVPFAEVPPTGAEEAAGAVHLLEHPRLGTISHPYEWSFALLREAALFHLDLQLVLLEHGFALSDASAYNVQFVGPAPIFIDHLSIRPYREGEFWLGHRQFCEQFLNPLLLRSVLGVAHNAWYRGSLEGIATSDLARLLPLRKRLSWNVLVHVILQDRLQHTSRTGEDLGETLQGRRLPKAQFRAMLEQLRRWIAALRPAGERATTWANYATSNTYADDESAAKKRFVADFIRTQAPASVVDLGCNTGDYTKVCLDSGAQRVVGFDFDQQAIDAAHARAKAENLAFLPLYLDARNPSPNQGWLQAERAGFAGRFRADAVMALAFEHHLAIAHNVPLAQVLDFLLLIAPQGVVEFVPKSDPTVRTMLALRDDIFPEYDEDHFRHLLSQRARIIRDEQISASGRRMFAFAP